MVYTYDQMLVVLSVMVSMVGSYTCFNLVIKIRENNRQFIDKNVLAIAALVIGGSIWVMHFIAMLAVRLPITIRYDILITLISGLIAVLMTGLSLSIVSTAADNMHRRIIVAGIIMGIGISMMHHVGMSGIRGNLVLAHAMHWLLISVCVGIFASIASLFAAIRLHGLSRRLVAALVMGLSISGVHYTAMFGTSFVPVDNALSFTQPILSPFTLGLSVALSTFFILGYTLLSLVPNRVQTVPVDDEVIEIAEVVSEDQATQPSATESGDAQTPIDKIPLLRNKKTYFVSTDDIASISANGHYTTVLTTSNEEYFCNFSISRMEEKLDSSVFLRAHRSHIINIKRVQSFQQQHDKGLVFMQGMDKAIPVSRTYMGLVQNVLGM